MTDWTPAVEDHTFSTGRTATLRRKLPVQVMIRHALEAGEDDIITRLGEMERGELTDAATALRIQDSMVIAMFVHPRVVLPGDHVESNGVVISIDDLDDAEITEVVTMAMEGVAEATRFRGDGSGAGDGEDGEGVEPKPKRTRGSAKGKRARTDFGTHVVTDTNRVGMLVDVSHMGYAATMEVFEISQDPVIFSHSNPAGLRAHVRNISDEQIKACAQTGGVIGINGIADFLGGTTSERFIEHIEYVIDLAGPDHVGIGLDYVVDKQ